MTDDDHITDEMLEEADAERKARREEAIQQVAAGETLPEASDSFHDRRLAERMQDPEFAAAYDRELYKAYRNANKPFRRAFGRGERWRMTLLKCAEARIRELEK